MQYFSEHQLSDTIVEVVKQRAAATAKDLINDKDLKVYDFEGKKYLLRENVTQRISESQDRLAASLYDVINGLVNTPNAKNKIFQVNGPDRTVRFPKESVINYANEMLDGIL